MQLVDFQGGYLTPKSFISFFKKAKELAPPRFLTLRLHPDRYQDIFKMADVPQSIQVGVVRGPAGTMVTKVNCITPPMGVGDGMTIIQDKELDPSKIIVEIHGIAELIGQNIAHDPPTQST